MKNIIVALVVCCVLAFSASCGKKVDPAVANIIKRGRLIAGVKEDVQGFAKLNASTGEYEGIETELAKLIAGAIFGDPAKIEFVPVTDKKRSTYLDNGDVDIIIATYTITDERKKQWNFSQSYYTDAVGLLARKDSGLKSIDDFDGKNIGVSINTTTQAAIVAALDEKGKSAGFTQFATYADMRNALLGGKIDACSSDRSILRSYLTEEIVLLDDRFAPQDYGIASRLEDKALAAYIDNLLSTWKSDGTLGKLVLRFGLDAQL
ncbi:MAG: transporter substrate-binding domain-containing protein [Candidatus Accumulibacter sp.]|jgi:putative glutamine transport system substrate-binding protein|nr:transporter substrate-binding domain-containing protein [Accumulibacter sp.]